MNVQKPIQLFRHRDGTTIVFIKKTLHYAKEKTSAARRDAFTW